MANLLVITTDVMDNPAYTSIYENLEGIVPKAVLDIAACLPCDGCEALHTASEIYAQFGLHEQIDMTGTQTHDFETSPNKQGTIAITGGAGATWALYYIDDQGNAELYDNQPVAVDGDTWDIVLVYPTNRSRLVKTGGADAVVCITR